ncbi:hypothetical protein Q8A67_023843 [Cirrhinus molitorella]|uniref:Uncharacterized protein n=1 Tax=Cirrhinus molitorella TaxID=172907 RepID=A0AA88P0L2_9TELE|nr:hypothetical protein Q8A67_023843 [Cirrhinus molitorella]
MGNFEKRGRARAAIHILPALTQRCVRKLCANVSREYREVKNIPTTSLEDTRIWHTASGTRLLRSHNNCSRTLLWHVYNRHIGWIKRNDVTGNVLVSLYF